MTGATGFLGSRVARMLDAAGFEVLVLKRRGSSCHRIQDLLGHIEMADVESADLERLFANRSIDCVLHCATQYGRDGDCPDAVLDTNVKLPLQLAEVANHHGVRVFLNCDTVLDARVSRYALSKAEFRESMAARPWAFEVIHVAFEHLYGPGDAPTKFVTAMALRMAGTTGSIPLTGGDQIRDFVYVDDAASAIQTILTHHLRRADGDNGHGAISRYSVGSGEGISIRDFLHLLRDLARRPDMALAFGSLPYRPNEPMKSVSSAQELRSLGWHPSTALREGLVRTLDEARERSA